MLLFSTSLWLLMAMLLIGVAMVAKTIVSYSQRRRCSVSDRLSTGTYYRPVKFPWTKPIIIISGIFVLVYTSQIKGILSISTLKQAWYSPKNSKRNIFGRYRPLLPPVSLPAVCHLQTIGVNRSWPFAMDLKRSFSYRAHPKQLN